MKLFFAAPLSGLPSDPTALGAHASRLHLRIVPCAAGWNRHAGETLVEREMPPFWLH
jgi:hypothetical protein